MYVRTCVRTYACTHTCSQAHTCMYVRMYHTRSHVQTHTRMHTQTSHSSHVRSGAGLCPFRGTTKLSPVWSRNWGEEEENRASGNVRMNKHHKLTVCVSTYVYTYIYTYEYHIVTYCTYTYIRTCSTRSKLITSSTEQSQQYSRGYRPGIMANDSVQTLSISAHKYVQTCMH